MTVYQEIASDLRDHAKRIARSPIHKFELPLIALLEQAAVALESQERIITSQAEAVREATHALKAANLTLNPTEEDTVIGATRAAH